jgi:hypothetical protein
LLVEIWDRHGICREKQPIGSDRFVGECPNGPIAQVIPAAVPTDVHD